jgi:hypothetical protein
MHSRIHLMASWHHLTPPPEPESPSAWSGETTGLHDGTIPKGVAACGGLDE